MDGLGTGSAGVGTGTGAGAASTGAAASNGSTGGVGNQNTNTGANNNNQTGNNNAGQQNNNQQGQQSDTTNLERLIQSAVDRATQRLGTENKQLKSQIEQLQTMNMTDAEKHEHAMSEREKALKAGEAALKMEKNKMYAVAAIKNAGLDDGSADSMGLIDLVMDEDEKGIDAKVKALSTLVTSLVQKEVNKTFAQNGRNPARGDSGNNDGPDKKVELGSKLGKRQAEVNKRSQSVLNMYTGRNK